MAKRPQLTEMMIDGVLYQAKPCTKCNVVKPLDDFHTSNSKGLGNRVSKCKSCINTGFKWSKSKIGETLLKLHRDGFDLSQTNLKKHYSGMLKSCKREYGSYKNALKELGIDYTDYVEKPFETYNTETLLEHLNKYIEDNGSAIRYSQEHELKYRAIISRFGSFRKALKEIKKEDEWFVDWNKEFIINELIKSSENGVVSRNNISKLIYHAACREFGNFASAAKKANLEYDRVVFRRRTKDDVINEIRNLDQLSYCIVENKNESLIGAGRRFFGSWEKAIEAAGFSYEEVREDKATTNYCGWQFEKVADSLLSDLNIQYAKYQHERWNPDYVFKNQIWGDAKLSEWTDRIGTISNYERHCKMLLIIFMRGDKNRDKMITNKTRLISVHKLIKQLPKHKQKKYINKINEIEQYLNEKVPV